jgi:Rrf2 family transcriptional regulator, nitric oxide-sensitive transcriptional repressor
MLSQTSEYALRVIVFLGSLRGAPATTNQIAAATRVPAGYLSKILQTLVRAKLVHSQRGPGGGSVLTRDPAQITVYDVITAIDPLPRIETCPLNLPSHGTKLCPLHRRLDNAIALVEQAFRESRIADLLAEPTTSIPLTDIEANSAAATRAAEAAFPVERTVPLNLPKRRTATKPKSH